ncbi:MAG: 50S ribosomal protein L9, partial [Endomicrobiales bacterium]
ATIVEEVMKVILRTDIANVGRQGEIKEVSPGYARNYLVPRQMAMEATEANLKLWSKEKGKLEKQRDSVIKEAQELAQKVEKLSLTMTVRVGEAGKLFGSVTSTNIARALEENGFKIEKHDILLHEPIKELGVYTVDIRIHPEVIAKVKVWVVEEKQEKQEQEQEKEKEKEAPEPGK